MNQQMRKVTVWGQRGEGVTVEIGPEVQNWVQLKNILIAKGVSFTGMKVVEGYSQTDLVYDEQVLPTNIPMAGTVVNDLIIMMDADKRIKSGSEYSDLKAAIKQLREKFPEAKEFFGNYTQLPTSKMAHLLNKWNQRQHTAPKDPKDPISYKVVSCETKKAIFNQEEFARKMFKRHFGE